MPCPRCGEFQVLRWRDPDSGAFRLVWPKGHPEEARYLYAHCGAAWEEADKNAFLPAGVWRPDRPDLGEAGTIASFVLNALYSPLGMHSWADMARQWEKAAARAKAGDIEELRSFVNTRLAETFEEPGVHIDPSALANRLDPDWDAVPAGVKAIFIGVDVQDDRIEALTLGLGDGFEMWVLGYNVVLSAPLDRRVAYWLLPNHPGDAWGMAGLGATTPSRVDARDVLHLLQEARPGQVRGIPWLALVIMALWDLGGMADAERHRAKIAHCLTAFVESADSDDGTPPRPDGITGADGPNGNLVTDMQGDPVEALHPGLIGYLPPGKKITINSPTLPSGFDVCQRVGLHEIAAGVGLAYEVLTGDLSQVNFSSIRLGLNEQNWMVRALREQVFVPLAMQPLWEWFCEAGQVAGLLPLDVDEFPCRWSSPRVESVDRKTDAEADLREMRNGTRSRRDVIASYGQDPDTVDAEIAQDKDNRDRLRIVVDADPARVSMSGATQSRAGDSGTASLAPLDASSQRRTHRRSESP